MHLQQQTAAATPYYNNILNEYGGEITQPSHHLNDCNFAELLQQSEIKTNRPMGYSDRRLWGIFMGVALLKGLHYEAHKFHVEKSHLWRLLQLTLTYFMRILNFFQIVFIIRMVLQLKYTILIWIHYMYKAIWWLKFTYQ